MRNRLMMGATLLACAFALRAAEATYYQIELVPSGTVVSTDLPVTKGTMVVFHKYPSGTLVSMRRSELKTVTKVSAAAVQSANANPADAVIRIGNLAMQGGSAQAGPTNARAATAPKDKSGLGTGFYSDIVPGQTQAYGNSANDYKVGATYAYAPSNATQSSPGSPPTNPAMTNGQNPPQ
jgi:hypothetical protein